MYLLRNEKCPQGKSREEQILMLIMNHTVIKVVWSCRSLTVGVVAAELGVSTGCGRSSGRETRSFLAIWFNMNMSRHMISVVNTNRNDPIRYQSIILG